MCHSTLNEQAVSKSHKVYIVKVVLSSDCRQAVISRRYLKRYLPLYKHLLCTADEVSVASIHCSELSVNIIIIQISGWKTQQQEFWGEKKLNFSLVVFIKVNPTSFSKETATKFSVWDISRVSRRILCPHIFIEFKILSSGHMGTIFLWHLVFANVRRWCVQHTAWFQKKKKKRKHFNKMQDSVALLTWLQLRWSQYVCSCQRW